MELLDRRVFRDNSVAVGSAWSPAFCSSSKKKPVAQKSEPRIGCGATCRAALPLVASRQLKLVQPPIPPILFVLLREVTRGGPPPFLSVLHLHYRGSCFHNFQPSICPFDETLELQLATIGSSRSGSFFYYFSFLFKLSRYDLRTIISGNSIS